jgi:16S rRNA (uracil1498-N3)-methyltransferase
MSGGSDGRRELSFSQLVIPDLTPDSVLVSGNEGRHLLKSLRGRVGDRVRATDGRGCIAYLEIAELSRSQATLLVLERELVAAPRQRWWLATRAAGSRFDWLVEKAVELGAWAILPLAGDSPTRGGRGHRWQRVADAALSQCQAAWGLRVSGPEGLERILDSPSCERWSRVVWADPGGRNAGDVDPAALPEGDLLLVVGPPEGFSEPLRRRLADSSDILTIALGERRLRSESAALAGLVWARCTGRSQETFKSSG